MVIFFVFYHKYSPLFIDFNISKKGKIMERALKRRVLSPVTKGVLTAVCFSVVAVLLFAVIYKFVDISDVAIKVINQIIKVMSIALGVHVSLKHDKSRGALKGALIGALYMLLAYTIFSILVATFSFSLSIIFDILFSVLVGVICGAFMANLKKY